VSTHSDRAKAHWAKKTPEERSEIARKRAAIRTPEEVRAWADKARATCAAKVPEGGRVPTVRPRRSRKKLPEDLLSSEERSAIRRAAWAKKTPEERARHLARMHAGFIAMAPEARARIQANLRPGAQATAHLTHEERAEFMRRVWAARSPEEKRDIARKAAASYGADRRSANAARQWAQLGPAERRRLVARISEGCRLREARRAERFAEIERRRTAGFTRHPPIPAAVSAPGRLPPNRDTAAADEGLALLERWAEAGSWSAAPTEEQMSALARGEILVRGRNRR
jgi:hypothetical protein